MTENREQLASHLRRTVIYAVSRSVRRVDDYVDHALVALRAHADRLIIIVPNGTSDEDRARFASVADAIHISPYERFDPSVYQRAIEREPTAAHADEYILTGDSWFGPLGQFAPILERMQHVPTPVWGMVENTAGEAESFPAEGFPAPHDAWLWTAMGPEEFTPAIWERFAAESPAGRTEYAFHRWLGANGRAVSYAFTADEFSSEDPGLYTPIALVDAGCPFVRRDIFTRYPPFLDRFAVVGREILGEIEARGFAVSLILQNLSRTVPPKALNTTAGLLEVLPGIGAGYDPSRPLRIAAIIHTSHAAGLQELLERLSFLPTEFDLFITATDGKRATEAQRIVENFDHGARSVDYRVTPANPGRDMGDFFVGCRDVLLGDDYDLVIKLRARRMRSKTDNVRQYFRRYQFENLLASPGHVAEVLALFQREEGLGTVFPPMMHIGYHLMGRGWGPYRAVAERLAERLGIHVPFDNVSPLAPYGAMWIGRPQALQLLTAQRWRYRDYQPRGGRYPDLARVQERLIVYAGAELGFHSRTVLTPEHAAISHTALEAKADELFATTRGWPVEQIQLMHRAGFTGHGGVVALMRMYVRLNHPRLARLLHPLYTVAVRGFVVVNGLRATARKLFAMLRGRSTGEIQ